MKEKQVLRFRMLGSFTYGEKGTVTFAIFESLMLLIGYFVKTKNDDDDEEKNA